MVSTRPVHNLPVASQVNRPIILGLSGVVKRNTEIGTIPIWGPLFRVSFDLKINSLASGNRGGWSSVLSFKKDGGARNMAQIGDRIPAIFLNKKGFLHFCSSVNRNRNYCVNFNSIKLEKWYNISLAQTWENGKVRETEKNHYIT